MFHSQSRISWLVFRLLAFCENVKPNARDHSEGCHKSPLWSGDFLICSSVIGALFFLVKSVRNAKHFFSLVDMLRSLKNLMVNSRTWFIPGLVSASSIKSSAKAMEFILWVLSETPSWTGNSSSNSSTIRLKGRADLRV